MECIFDLDKEYNIIVEKVHTKAKSSDLENKIHQTIYDMFSNVGSKEPVIIRGGGEHTEKLLEVVFKKHPQDSFNIIAIVDNGLAGTDIMNIPVVDKKEAECLKYEKVIISSYSYAEEMKKDYQGSEVQILDVYEYLRNIGINLSAPFYYYRKNKYEIALYYKREYFENPSYKTLQYLIDAALEIKDFKTAFNYIDIYIENNYMERGLYQKLKEELLGLLSKAKEVIAGKGNNIVMFWIDAVYYDNLKLFPNLNSKRNTTCFFEKTYTVTSYTKPVMHSMFQGYSRIDDYEETQKKIDENSEVISSLRDAGYEFLYIGNEGSHGFSEKCRLDDGGRKYSRCLCINCWRLLCCLCKSNTSTFYIVHSLEESHPPQMALSFEDAYSYKLEEIIARGQDKKAYLYADEQIEFYSDFLGDNFTKIYMSDHGDIRDLKLFHFTEHRIHPFFMIEGSKIRPQKIDKLFSYNQFKYIVRWLLFNSDEDFNKALSEYVLIQDVDVYNPPLVRSFMKKGGIETCMSYRGVVTEKDKYVHLRNGKELYYELHDGKEVLIEDNIPHDRINELRRLAGDNFLDLYKYDEFKTTREIFSDNNII